jgi:isopentenyldiphosphate isomerase
MVEIVPIVNDKDKIIAYKNRDDILDEDIYRITALWITNSTNEILIAQRTLTKKINPGKWGPAVAGTVAKGETYKTTIVREALEELGLKNIKPKTGPKQRSNGTHKYFRQWYFLKLDINLKDLKLQKSEVQNVRWISRKDLLKDIKNNPKKYLRRMLSYVEEFA